MEASPPPPPPIDLPTNLYYQLVHTLTNLLPPPLDDSPEALHARNHAAIAKVAALLPVNANEADLAAQCIAARAQAEDILRLLRQNPHDIALVMRLNAQYGSMVRTSLAVHARLMRVQAQRHKRASIDGAANQDARAQDVAELSMLRVVYPDPEPRQAVSPERAPAACADQEIGKHASENKTDSQHAAFETWLSEQPWNQQPAGPGEPSLHKIAEAMANWHAACPQLPGTGRESPGSTNYDRDTEEEKASSCGSASA